MSHTRFLDQAPSDAELTDYDREHLKTYLRLLDAEAAGASWQEVCTTVFGIDPIAEASRAKTMHASHLVRAHWLRDHGYRNLL